MSHSGKLIAKLLRFPSRMRFSEVKAILEAHGYQLRKSSGGSHHIFAKKGQPPIDIPTVNGREVKSAYLRIVAERLNLKE